MDSINCSWKLKPSAALRRARMILIHFVRSYMVLQGANAGVNALKALAEYVIVCKDLH
jgi:hypothetical protein